MGRGRKKREKKRGKKKKKKLGEKTDFYLNTAIMAVFK